MSTAPADPRKRKGTAGMRPEAPARPVVLQGESRAHIAAPTGIPQSPNRPESSAVAFSSHANRAPETSSVIAAPNVALSSSSTAAPPTAQSTAPRANIMHIPKKIRVGAPATPAAGMNGRHPGGSHNDVDVPRIQGGPSRWHEAGTKMEQVLKCLSLQTVI